MNENLYLEFAGCLRHFTQLQYLHLEVYHEVGIIDAWEFIATFLSTASLTQNLKDLSVSIEWSTMWFKESIDLANGCEFVLRNVKALESILDNSFKDLLTMVLKLVLHWPIGFRDKKDQIRTQFSQSAVEDAVRKKLSELSRKASVSVSAVEHEF